MNYPVEFGAMRPLSAESSDLLGDKRRSRRHGLILDQLSRSAAASFPQTFGNKAALEGFYRFVENDAIDDSNILSGHIAETVQRGAAQQEFLVVHDTTDVRYPLLDEDWLRENLARPTTQTQGYELHASLLVANGEHGVPLGIVDTTPFVHAADVKHSKETQRWWSERNGLFANEAKRWFDGVQNASERLGEHSSSAVHVMDREADRFTMLHWLMHQRHRFIIRAKHLKRPAVIAEDPAPTNRSEPDNNKEKTPRALIDVLNRLPFVGEVEAHLGFRTPFRNAKKQRAHPPRKERVARLSVRAARVTLSRGQAKDLGYSPLDRSEIPKSITLYAVELVERRPPARQTPVRWVLFTNEPIHSPEDIFWVVDSYRRRWLIEEFFKALKTGCALEKRQMDSAGRLLNVLALLLPVAWSLLMTRTLERQGVDLPWRFLVSPLAFSILSRAAPTQRLDKDSTAADVMRAIAGLGGHLKSNGPPGWLTLQRGLEKLATLMWGAQLAAGEPA